jgi:tRNA1Val (adenine37-N6)-methyltransferase
MSEGCNEENRRTEELVNGYRLIRPDRHARLGMDAVMLSAFLSPSKAVKICELGCGAGAVSILLAARYSEATIDGVEIQETAATLFEENIALNGLDGRVRSLNADLRSLDGILPPGAYTAVVCNPPYFRRGQGKISDSPERRVERSEAESDLDSVCRAAARLLDNGGELAMVFRAERLCDVILSMRQSGVEPKRLKFVHHGLRNSPKLFLISGRKNARPGLAVEAPLVIRTEDGSFSDEYLGIYRGKNI